MSSASRLLARAAHAQHLQPAARPLRPWPRSACTHATSRSSTRRCPSTQQQRSLATLPDPRTPTGSIVLRRPPSTAVVSDSGPVLVPAPAPGDGPLLERRADRELPKYVPWWMPWAKTLPIFAALITVAALGIFNYQKLSSSVVSSILYALRTDARARDALGGEIYFRDRVPWIWGTMNQLHGVLDIGFGVKGTKGSGFVRFRSRRPERLGFYETTEWSLELPDGTVLQLLDGDTAGRLSGSINPAAGAGVAPAQAKSVA